MKAILEEYALIIIVVLCALIMIAFAPSLTGNIKDKWSSSINNVGVKVSGEEIPYKLGEGWRKEGDKLFIIGGNVRPYAPTAQPIFADLTFTVKKEATISFNYVYEALLKWDAGGQFTIYKNGTKVDSFLATEKPNDSHITRDTKNYTSKLQAGDYQIIFEACQYDDGSLAIDSNYVTNLKITGN